MQSANIVSCDNIFFRLFSFTHPWNYLNNHRLFKMCKVHNGASIGRSFITKAVESRWFKRPLFHLQSKQNVMVPKAFCWSSKNKQIFVLFFLPVPCIFVIFVFILSHFCLSSIVALCDFYTRFFIAPHSAVHVYYFHPKVRIMSNNST